MKKCPKFLSEVTKMLVSRRIEGAA